MDPFVDQLASLCQQHVTRAKWVFVPSHALGRTLGERIALNGTNWLNLRFVTPTEIALRMGAPFLVERGIDPSEEGLGPALMMRLMLDLPLQGGYFRSLADHPTLAQALWSTIRELRMAGVKATDLKAGAFTSAEKYRELRALLAAYEQFLASNNRGDMAVVYEEALAHLDWCPVQPTDCWTELPDMAWSPLQRRLFASVPGERITPETWTLPGTTMPRRLANADVHRLAPAPKSARVAFLLDPHCESETATPAIDLFHAGGREAEIDEVIRRILAAGAPLDQVEIACASDAHVSLVWEKALLREWPVTLGHGVPAARTRPGRALLELCDWVETDFSAAHLRHLLQSGDMGLEADDEGFTAGQAARVLGRAEPGWGRATYGLALSRLRKAYEIRAADPDLDDDDREDARTQALLTTRVLTWIEQLIAMFPEPATNGTVPLQTIVEGAIRYVDHSTARHSALDARAATALVDSIKELRALGTFSCALGEALRFLRERVQSLQVAPERPRPGHLHVCTLSDVGYAGRPHVFVVGLEEGRVFPAAVEDPVLLDAERAAISPALRLSIDRIDEAVYAVLSRLATSGADGRDDESRTGAAQSAACITFSYSCRDTREFRETYASWLMLQAFRLEQRDAARSYPQMKAALGEPTSAIPEHRDEASSATAWWMHSIRGTGEAGVAAVEAWFDRLARARAADVARRSDAFTEFDGHVPEAGAVLDPSASHNTFSVTDLESAASCPFRLFLKRGLGLRPVDRRERDRDVWLDPLTRGSALHDIYATTLRRCRDAQRRPNPQQDGPWLRDLAASRLAALHREMPAATEEIFDRESREFLADVDLFLEAESHERTRTPIGFEVSFGRPLDGEVEPLARAEAVEIGLVDGLTLRIAGRIDRIDQVGADFEVVDYKTGGYWHDDWQGVFAGGTRLQHALYGLAAMHLLRRQHPAPAVVAGVYYFSSRKGRQERVRIPAPAAGKISAVLEDLRAVIMAGTFVHAPDSDACTFCDYRAACGDDVNAQAAVKLQDARLKTYGRLAAHD
jgi:RecB family exonuclease